MIRKVIRIGNSDGVTIPINTLRRMKMRVGDRIEVFISRPGGTARDLEVINLLNEFKKRRIEE